jgi:hypothetical protein
VDRVTKLFDRCQHTDDFRQRLMARPFTPSPPTSCRSWPHAAHRYGVVQGRFRRWDGTCLRDGNGFPRHIEAFKPGEVPWHRLRGDKDADALSRRAGWILEATQGLHVIESIVRWSRCQVC